MKHSVFSTMLIAILSPKVRCSRAPFDEFMHNVLEKRVSQSLSTTTVISTVTTTTTTTKVSTVTMCPTGTHSATRPLSTTTKPQLTTSRPTSSSIPTTTAASTEPTFDGCTYNVPEAGKFKNKKDFTFYQQGLPDGLYASDYIVYDTYDNLPYNHRFELSNVYVDGDFLNLRVRGTNTPDTLQDQAVSCGEVVTTENNILYASVRTNAIFSDVPGTCHGIFFYLDDTQECDIEYLTDPDSQANNIYASSKNGAPIPLWYSNQATLSHRKPTNGVGPAAWDVTAVHEYRIDWTKDFTAFYLDGALQKKYTSNVPTKPGSWIWNNWANGDPNWSMGPPKQDSIMKIQNITMYYNTVGDKTC